MIVNPVRYIRVGLMPPCSQCKHCGEVILRKSLPCYSTKVLDHYERTTGIKYEYLDNTFVRGTRFCTFEPREDE